MIDFLELKLLIVFAVLFALTLCGFKFFGMYGGSWLECFTAPIALFAVFGFVLSMVILFGR